MWRVGVLVVVGSCGRLGFDETALTGDAPATTDAAPVRCPDGAILCEDFEAPLMGWTTKANPGATVDRTMDRPHRGRYALAARVPQIADGARAALERPVPPQGVLALRMWVRAVQPLIDYSTVFSVYETDFEGYLSAGGDESGNWVATSKRPTTITLDHKSTTPIGVDVWTCLEVVITSGAASRVQIYVEDALALDAAIEDPSPGYVSVELGLSRADLLGAQADLDDVVIDDQRIGCQ